MLLYKYGMRLRGFSIGCQPMDGFIGRIDDKMGKYYDILIYNRLLKNDELKAYELDYLKTEYVDNTLKAPLQEKNKKAFKKEYKKDFDDRYEDFRTIIEGNIRLSNRNAQLEANLSEFKKPIDKFIKNREKYAVKKFAKKLKEQMNERDYMGVKYKQGVFSENDIDKLLKEYENEL